MCSNTLPKEFEKKSEVLPFTKYGLSSIEEFSRAEEEVRHLELLKKAGLTTDEIKLYQENECGKLNQQNKVETGVLKQKLHYIYTRIQNLKEQVKQQNNQPSTSKTDVSIKNLERNIPKNTYCDGHPMNDIKTLENCLFAHLKDDILPLSKRRKLLRRLERKKERILSQNNTVILDNSNRKPVNRPGSLWDVKELQHKISDPERNKDKLIGPVKKTLYTIKNNKIVRLEPMDSSENSEDEYRAVNIVVPINNAEAQLLEGTKMSIDDIKKIDRFKDYEPGTPSKVLYLKNIAPTVTQQQLSVLFNQFVLDNGGPIDVRLMTGRMRGQAFVRFQNENLAIQALTEINGTIVCGRPIIAQFGRNTNRVQRHER
ncbi:RNA-binding protein 41 [Bombyx mori]|uniref:RRM domain-containing protein n=1 Tax=Bombyx mori TaxID=7091 RepID=A0A8R2AKA3_BOMMO|nr:RNA-binding protein 41 [Bombyx mori]